MTLPALITGTLLGTILTIITSWMKLRTNKHPIEPADLTIPTILGAGTILYLTLGALLH